MSILVSFPIETYRDYAASAFNKFAPAADDLTIANAKALMWFTQLAYEYGANQNAKISLAKNLWGFNAITPFQAKRGGTYDTHGLIGQRDDAVAPVRQHLAEPFKQHPLFGQPG